jgi:type IV secretory pathway TraG/TraD family ATPase VirD4
MIPGKPMGDGHFFSHSRELNGVGFLATQSVNMLQSSSLKDSWRAVWSNLNTKIFMRLADGETLKEAPKLGGQCDWHVTGHGTSRSRDGAGSSRDRQLQQREALPAENFTQLLRRGEGFMFGSVDGGLTRPRTNFFAAPWFDSEEGRHAAQ